MNEMTKRVSGDPSKVVDLVKRAFYLGYKACGGTSGMGFLQARADATEDDVWKNVCSRGDYSGGYLGGMPQIEKGEAYGDYVFGRMMKLRFDFNAKDGTVKFNANKPRPDYQGWSGSKYPTYEALINAAASELGLSLIDAAEVQA